MEVGIPAEKKETNTGRGRPHIYIALLAEGRPRITGLKIAGNHVRIILRCFRDSKKRTFTYVSGGLIFAAKCGENRLTVLVTFSLKVPAKL